MNSRLLELYRGNSREGNLLLFMLTASGGAFR